MIICSSVSVQEGNSPEGTEFSNLSAECLPMHAGNNLCLDLYSGQIGVLVVTRNAYIPDQRVCDKAR